jgi:zinc protease
MKAALLPLVALLAGPAALAQPKPPPTQSPTAVREATLKNGMKVLLLEDHAAPVATFSVFYRVGSRNESAGTTGSAHLLEHMMFKGTESRKKGEIMSSLDRVGAQWNASTFYDYTNYYETVPIEKLEFAVQLEADRMVKSLILDQERDLERIVVRNELERGENSPTRSLTEDLFSTAYKAHPYHHPVIGWRADVEGVPTSELRSFYKTFYQPDNAIAVVVGDFKSDQALALIEKYFAPLPGGHNFPAVYTTEPEQYGERRITLQKPGDIKVVAVAYKSPAASDADTIPLKLLHLILTGELDLGPFGDPLSPGISNRLYQALVEKELATSAGIDYTPLKDPGLFLVMALPRPDVDHAKVEAVIRQEIERLKKEPVKPEELERAKSRAQAAYGLMQDGTSGRAMLLGYFAAIADWKLADEFPARVRAVSADDLQRVARKYFVEKSSTVGWFVPTGEERASLESRSAGERAAAAEMHLPAQLEAFRGRESIAATLRAAVPASGQSPVQRTVLKNGLVVLVKENHSSPTFSISGTIRAGGAFDPKDRPDTAEVTADMLMRGTTRHDKLQIANLLEGVGASLDYGAGAEDVTVGARGLSKDFDRVLDLLAETLTEPSFPGEEVEKLKRQAIAQLQQAEDSPSTKARRAFYEALYPKGHPYYVYPLKEEMAALQTLDPAALKAFHQRFYGAQGVSLVVVGDVDGKKVVEAIQRRLGGLKATGVAKFEIPEVPLRKGPGREVIFVPEKANVDVMLGHQGSIRRTDSDYYPAQLANFAFGGSASSRLFQEVRDRRGLTYGIFSMLSASHGAGPWTVWMTLNPTNVDKALPLVEELTKSFVQNGLTDDELARAKETLVGKYKVGLATNSGMAGVLATFESYGFPPDYYLRHPGFIEAVSREQVTAALQKHFHPADALLVIAGTYPPPKEGVGGSAQPPEKKAPQDGGQK